MSGRTCTICAHPEREAIDRALVNGNGAIRRIASQHNLIETSVRRHKAEHLPAALVKAQEAQEVAQADTLLNQVKDLQKRALAILDKAEAAGDLRAALMAIREARGNLELLAKLLGELDERAQMNVLISPQWVQVRTVLLQVLAPYPEACAAVAGSLARLEGVHAGV